MGSKWSNSRNISDKSKKSNKKVVVNKPSQGSNVGGVPNLEEGNVVITYKEDGVVKTEVIKEHKTVDFNIAEFLTNYFNSADSGSPLKVFAHGTMFSFIDYVEKVSVLYSYYYLGGISFKDEGSLTEEEKNLKTFIEKTILHNGFGLMATMDYINSRIVSILAGNTGYSEEVLNTLITKINDLQTFLGSFKGVDDDTSASKYIGDVKSGKVKPLPDTGFLTENLENIIKNM